MMNDWKFLIVVTMMLASWFYSGCDNGMNTENPTNRARRHEVLSEKEVEIKVALAGLLSAKVDSTTHGNECASTGDFLKRAIRLLHSDASNINQHAILSQLRQEVLAMEISEMVDGGAQRETGRSRMSRFIDAAYSVSDLSSALHNNIPDFEHLVFDMEIDRRLQKAVNRPVKGGDAMPIVADRVISAWQWHSFYSPDSDLHRYWSRASKEERRSVLEWFRNSKEQIPDWAH